MGFTVVITSCGMAALTPPAATAASYPSADVTIVGHGFGHGQGMGQWGAFGYALDGLTWQEIVDHYYAGSTPAQLTAPQENTSVRVVLTENNGNDVIVTSGNGFTVDGTPIGPGKAVLMHSIGGGAWDLYSGSGCAGPTWTSFATGVENPEASPDDDPALGAGNASTLALQLCQVPANISVRGSLEATYNTGNPASPRTVNVVPLEDYVAGVVPNESPAYWGQIGSIGAQGEPQGFQELEAQAVAARSYVMAGLGSYGDYADTCDLACQTYHGLENENPLTDAATLDTSGYVMEYGDDGVPLTTEYSSSTGGYTAPGVFPAVPDAGDSVCPPGIAGACNPNHTWNVSIPVTTVESTWPQLGTLQSIAVTSRNGFGDLGGRVLSMTLVGSSQSVVLTGDQFAASLGLMSDWFALTDSLPAPAVSMASTPDGKGYWIDGSDGSVVALGDATYLGSMSGVTLAAPVVGMAATPDGKGYWEVAADGGIFAFGDAGFYGSMGGRPLNRPIVGMAAAPDGKGYWEVASDGGIFAFGDAGFHGSMGGQPLNRPVVGMARTPDGKGYWEVASDGGIFSFGDAGFHGSMGGQPLNRPVVGMAEVPGGTGYWEVASDGGVFSFGTASFHGSAGNLVLVQPVVGMARTSDGEGYWLVAADGGLFSYGDASFYGSGTS
ncbi:MAG: SpoIID/LytB domain-containing protein [Acidimicrobiales bacterium]